MSNDRPGDGYASTVRIGKRRVIIAHDPEPLKPTRWERARLLASRHGEKLFYGLVLPILVGIIVTALQ